MTTQEIKERLAQITGEINKVKAYNTRLAKKLIEHNIPVPPPNWTEKEKSEEEGN